MKTIDHEHELRADDGAGISFAMVIFLGAILTVWMAYEKFAGFFRRLFHL